MRWPLRLSPEIHEGIPVLVAAGRVSHASAAGLTAALEEAISGGSKATAVILDLHHVDYLSSAGVSAIETVAHRLAAANVAFVLVAPSSQVRITLDLAGVLAGVAIEPTRDLAMGRIGKRPVS